MRITRHACVERHESPDAPLRTLRVTLARGENRSDVPLRPDAGRGESRQTRKRNGERMSNLEDRNEIRELYARYCFYVDEGRPDLFAAQFTDDGVLWLSDRGSFVGRTEIEAHVTSRAGKTFHLIHNVAVDRVEGDSAYAHAYFQLLNPSTGACVAYGTYDDALRRVHDRWRWNRKRVNYRFRTTEYAAVADSMRRPDFGTEPEGVPTFGESNP